jgi:hypothetical protein
VLFVAGVLDSEYEVHEAEVDGGRWYAIAQSTRVQDVADQSGRPESTILADESSRYVWRIYSISKYEQRDGGVYVEQENIVLSRAIPTPLKWLVQPATQRLSRRMTETSLRQTRDAVRSIANSHLPSADFPAQSN